VDIVFRELPALVLVAEEVSYYRQHSSSGLDGNMESGADDLCHGTSDLRKRHIDPQSTYP